MEAEKRKAMDDVTCHSRKQLNFNAPLLSIKRQGSSIGEENCCTDSNKGIRKFQDTISDMIPFSWEQAAGKPKDSGKSDSITLDDDDATPRLRIPPGRLWYHHHPRREFTRSCYNHQDHSCDADVDDDYGDDNKVDGFSDTADVLSLTEAMDIVERAEKGTNGLDGFNLESNGHDQSISPSYMIDRFLPDAAALAASSSVSNKSLKKIPYNHPQVCVPQAVRRSYTAVPEGCGLEMLFRWRMKHRICGVKSPVRQGSSAKGQHDYEHTSRN